jgi:hypothetical protein
VRSCEDVARSRESESESEVGIMQSELIGAKCA